MSSRVSTASDQESSLTKFVVRIVNAIQFCICNRSAMENLQQCLGIFLPYLLKHVLKRKTSRIMILSLFYI